MTKAEGLALLDNLWNSLTASEQKERKKAYNDAKAYIQKSPASGVCKDEERKIKPKTFKDPQRKDSSARIDIEIITGCAFKD